MARSPLRAFSDIRIVYAKSSWTDSRLRGANWHGRTKPTRYHAAGAGNRAPSSIWPAINGSRTPHGRDQSHFPDQDAALPVAAARNITVVRLIGNALTVTAPEIELYATYIRFSQDRC
jgi:hypothetical protein